MGQALRQEKYLESINYLDTLHGDSKGWITKAEMNWSKISSKRMYI